jgi:polysaccharide export outer membrane protein
MPLTRRAVLSLASVLGLGLTAATAADRSRTSFTDLPYAQWTEDEPSYRLYPGDEIDVAVPSAPELSRSLKVGPDGRVDLPLIGAVMASDRSTAELARELERAYMPLLVRPEVEVALKQAAPVKVFVGGEVGLPGVYEIVGDALQAVMMAGGFKATGHPGSVVILRRGGDGRAMMRTADLAAALKSPVRGDRVPLRRFDIVFVPRSGVAEVGAYMGVIIAALPLSFSYALTNPYK